MIFTKGHIAHTDTVANAVMSEVFAYAVSIFLRERGGGRLRRRHRLVPSRSFLLPIPLAHGIERRVLFFCARSLVSCA